MFFQQTTKSNPCLKLLPKFGYQRRKLAWQRRAAPSYLQSLAWLCSLVSFSSDEYSDSSSEPLAKKTSCPALFASGHNVTVLVPSEKGGSEWNGVRLIPYRLDRVSKDAHPWTIDFESKVIRGEACFRAALALKNSGYSPEITLLTQAGERPVSKRSVASDQA